MSQQLPGQPHILVVDDEPSVVQFVTLALSQQYEVDGISSPEEALEILSRKKHHMLVTDLNMPGLSGLELMKKAKEACPNLICVVMTAYADKTNAIEALKVGAYDFLEKPLALDLLMEAIARSWRGYRAEMENYRLMDQLRRREVAERHTARISRIPLGAEYESPGMKNVCEKIDELVAQPGKPILIVGEMGTGRSWVGHRIHARSHRAHKPILDVPANALNLDGDAVDLNGVIESADSGTLLLRNVHALDPEAQQELLQAIRREQGDDLERAPVQIIATADREIETLVATRAFDPALHVLLKQRQVDVPALRERAEDIQQLACEILGSLSLEYGRQVVIADPDVLVGLARLPWPGNISELRNVLERAVLLGKEEIEMRDFAHLQPADA